MLFDHIAVRLHFVRQCHSYASCDYKQINAVLIYTVAYVSTVAILCLDYIQNLSERVIIYRHSVSHCQKQERNVYPPAWFSSTVTHFGRVYVHKCRLSNPRPWG